MGDFRVRIDLIFDSSDEGRARGLYNHAKGQLGFALNINPDVDWGERSYVSLEECFHRTGGECIILEREEAE